VSNSYTYGTLVRVSGAFTDDAGKALDPDAVECQLIAPTGTKTSYAYSAVPDEGVVQDAPGRYHYDIDAHIAGVWHYRWCSTGTGQAADEFHFKVQPSRFD